MDIEFRLWLKKGDKKVFGVGPRNLLRQVEVFGSLRQAALSLNMSYSKAWEIIKMLEENLGYRLIESRTGGNHGGGSYLTTEGKKLLTGFEKLGEELEIFMREKAQDILSGL